jgi:hypothetical protein
LSSPNSSLSLVSSQHAGRPAIGLKAHQDKSDARKADTVKRWVELWPLRDGDAKGRFKREVIVDILKSLHELKSMRPNASLDALLKRLGEIFNNLSTLASVTDTDTDTGI